MAQIFAGHFPHLPPSAKPGKSITKNLLNAILHGRRIPSADSDEAAPLFRDDYAPGFRDDLAPL
jgi:hypothetical protein